MLYSEPELRADDLRVIEEIEASHAEFRSRLAEPRRWQEQLRRSLAAAAVRGSTHIEGYTITAEDAETLIAGGEISVETDEATRNAVTGYRDALTYIQRAAQFTIFSWDHTLLSALHFMMTRADDTISPGAYRDRGVWVSGGPNRPPIYEAPPPELVPDLMAELLEDLSTPDGRPALIRAAMAHLNLVSIHPWLDGNGRMSRSVHTLVLARDGVLAPEFSSIEEWLGSDDFNTREYYAALRTVQAGSFRRTDYQHEEGLTRDQALADLRTLRRANLIEAVGHARTQRYTAGRALRESECRSPSRGPQRALPRALPAVTRPGCLSITALQHLHFSVGSMLLFVWFRRF